MGSWPFGGPSTGLRATFCPLWAPDVVGNGVHIHLSLWHPDGRPAMWAADGPDGLSEPATAFVAGLLRHMPAAAALTAPSVLSYTRLVPHRWSAAFNNLGFALYSTLLNWGRSTLGVIPFVWLGAQYYGATGVIAGWALGAVVFGIAAVFLCFRVIGTIEQRDRPGHDRTPGPPPTANSPFSTGKAATLG